MPAPTNQDPEDAIDLGTLPCDITQDVHDAGVTYTVWYKFTAAADEAEIGIWGYGGGATYEPLTTIWTGTPGSLTNFLGIVSNGAPIQIPVIEGEIYYIRFATNSGTVTPASLRIRCLYSETNTVENGFIVVPDDFVGLPTSFMDPDGADYVIQNFWDEITSCEEGEMLENGCLLNDDNTTPVRLLYYDTNFNQTAIAAPSGT